MSIVPSPYWSLNIGNKSMKASTHPDDIAIETEEVEDLVAVHGLAEPVHHHDGSLLQHARALPVIVVLLLAERVLLAGRGARGSAAVWGRAATTAVTVLEWVGLLLFDNMRGGQTTNTYKSNSNMIH